MPFEIGGDDLGDVIAHLHGRLGHAGNLVAVLLEVGQVAEDKDLGQARRIEPVVDQDAARGRSVGAPSSLPSGEACDARGPERDRGSIVDAASALSASTQPGPTPVTCVCVWTSTPSLLELGFGLGGKILGIGGQHARCRHRAATRGSWRDRCGGSRGACRAGRCR